MIKFTTNLGSFTIKLDHEKAPLTAANFLQYAQDNFFAGTLFHRIIPGFMAQGGGILPGMGDKKDGQRAPIKNEANNGLKNNIGTVAMARTGDPHSATGQFFVNVANNDFLNFRAENAQGWGYCVFGEVSEGMDIIEKMMMQKTASNQGHQDVPVEDILIEKVEVVS
ncbi:peptidyl-prolyl cis-trans isomerase B [Gammaproteobacteria bacterium]|nr:peptidyl-prolyl cis-trans isomerase B [Gammaproteobacteria bacterium]